MTQIPEIELLLAQKHQESGRLVEAEAVLKRLLNAHPDYATAWHALGLLAYTAGKLPLAADLLAQAVTLRGDVGIYQRNLGEILRRLGRLEAAIAAGQRATALIPQDVDAHYNLGLAQADWQQWPPAITSYRRALELDPFHGLSWNNLGSALERSGDLAQAEVAYGRAIQINPQHIEAQNNLGALFSAQGKLGEAVRCFETALAAQPDFTEAHFNLSALKTYTADDPHLRYLEGIFDKANGMPLEARIRYLFALGKAREDVARYDDAFAAYAEGNRLKHATLPYDEDSAEKLMARIMAVFDHDFFAARALPTPHLGNKQRAPIFIVGMPRSGTSLVEQILATHPDIYGAGELKDMHQLIADSGQGRTYPDFATDLNADQLRRMGEDYMARVRKSASDALRITDKMPANFFYLGLIRLMLPDAKIIHAMRDPMDSCFSNYARLFSDTMEFAYDLGTLGRYYVRYIMLMRHWREVLPEDFILDLRYEDMVADTEGQTRRILDFIGLPWHEGCLDFHNNKRLVHTASVAQVRKPVYQTSVARWKHFEAHLHPLSDIVNNYR